MESLPQSFIKDGWLAEAFLRNYMSVNALNLMKGEIFFAILAIFWQFLKKSSIFAILSFWLFLATFGKGYHIFHQRLAGLN